MDDTETSSEADVEEITDADKCCKYHTRPCPINRAILALLLISLLERYAFFNVTDGIFIVAESYITNKAEGAIFNSRKHRVRSTVIAETVINSIPFLLYPFAGYIADVKYGRLNVITVGIGMCTSAYGVLALIFALGYAGVWSGWTISIPFIASFLVLCAGSAAVQVNMVPFLADQVNRPWGEELSSLFHWYYWTRNITGIGTIIHLLIFCPTRQGPRETAYLTFSASTVALSLAFCIIVCYKRWFYDQREVRNPLVLVAKVVWYARKAKYDPFQSAFTINKDPPPRLDLAKMRYGGPFTTSQVENVKTFYRLAMVLISTMGALMLITAIITVLQLGSKSLIKTTSCIFSSGSLLHIAEDLSILLFIPFLDKLLYPLLGGYTPSMKNRIGIGSVLCVLVAATLTAVFYSTGLQSGFPVAKNHPDDFTYGWYVPAVAIASAVILGLSEVFIEVGALEFAYAQASRDMKGFMIGLFYFTWGLGSLVAEVILYTSHSLAIASILSVIGLMFFSYLSANYKRRKLDDIQTDLDDLTYESALDVLRSQMRPSHR